MQLRRLGKQGPEISVVGYGAWEIGGEAYGPNASDDEVIEAIHAGLDEGINWIDTAEVYGRGRSEEIVGVAVRGRRDSVLVATKVAPSPGGTGYEPDKIREAAKKSLDRMKLDHIDLYQLHWKPEDSWNIEETWGAMSDLVDEGVVRYIGVSNFSKEQIERCLRVRHVDSLQPQFSMFHRQEEELISWCGTQGVGVVAYGPLAYGLLTGKISEKTRFGEADWRSGRAPDHPYYVELFAPGRLEHHLALVEKIKPIAERKGITMSQLALAWVFSKPGATAAIAGSRNPTHNRLNAAAGDVDLSKQDIEEIESFL